MSDIHNCVQKIKSAKITVIAGPLVQELNVNIDSITGTGANGRILIGDVKKAAKAQESSPVEASKPEIEEDKTEANASKKEVVADSGVIVSVGEEPALPVGDRVVMMMIERRTGLPIRQDIKMFGADPFFLTDGVVSVVAVRVQKKNRAAQEAFNLVLPEDVFEELFGESGPTEPEDESFIHRVESIRSTATPRIACGSHVGSMTSSGVTTSRELFGIG